MATQCTYYYVYVIQFSLEHFANEIYADCWLDSWLLLKINNASETKQKKTREKKLCFEITSTKQNVESVSE